MFLVVGLGNPGNRYARNRHNVGWRVLEEAASRAGVALDQRKFGARVGTGMWEGQKVAFVMPETYMNVSGEAVGPAMRFWKVDPAKVVVAYDELDLEFGDVRLKVGGGDAGHNGVRSLIAHLGPEFVRVRVGISRPRPGWDPADYVLSDFTGSEEASLPDVIDRAVEAARMVLAEGPHKAMNRFNKRRRGQSSEKPSTSRAVPATTTKPSRPSESEAAGGDEESPANREEN